MENSVIKKVIPSLIVGGIVGLLGLFFDVQQAKSQISANTARTEAQLAISLKNNKMICLMSLKQNMSKEDEIRFCVPD